MGIVGFIEPCYENGDYYDTPKAAATACSLTSEYL